MSGRMLYMQAITAIHSGTGQGIGYIDQPVARDPTTGWPIVPGSSIKGVLRARSEGIDPAMTTAVFGAKTANASDHAGAVLFPDAHLVALPVRSLYGSFAWVTCPLVLKHWERDMKGLGQAVSLPALSIGANSFDALVTTGSALVNNNTVYLEAYDFAANIFTDADAIAQAIAGSAFSDPAWQVIFTQRLMIVSGFVFDRLCDAALEVTARIRLQEETKTVARGGLWYEESVPAESIFATPLLAGDVDIDAVHGTRIAGVSMDRLWDHLRDISNEAMLQVGGNASVGKGLVRFTLEPEGK